MRVNYSNFAPNKYIYLPKFTANKNFKFIINCVTVHGTNWNTLLSKHTADSDFGLRSNNYWYWDEINSNISHSPISGQRYWICLYWSGTTYYFYYMIDDGTYTIDTLPIDDFTNWTLAVSQNKTTNIYQNYELDLGNWKKNQSNENYPWQGSIDLYNTRIYSDGVIWFDGKTQTTIENGYWNTGCNVSAGAGLTGFTATNVNYFRTVSDFTPSSADSWRIEGTICTPSNMLVAPQTILNPNANTNFYLGIYYNNFRYCTSNNGSSWTTAGALGNIGLKPETKYYIRISYDVATTTFKNEISEDGINYVTDYTETIAIYPSTTFIKFGLAPNGSEPYLGVISPNDFTIYINNTVWYDGQNAIKDTDYSVVGTLYETPHAKIASRFSNSNYITVPPIKYNANSKNAKGIVRAYFVQATYAQDIITRSSGADRCWCFQASNSSNANRLDFYNGYSHLSPTVFKNNTWYWVGYEWNGQTYKFYSMEDTGKYLSYKELPNFSNTEWILEAQYDDTNNLYETGFNLGYNVVANNSNRYWRGQIDLGNTILGNNVIAWKVGKVGYITQFDTETITENTTHAITLVQGKTLTIVPTPADAKVTMWAKGYKQTEGTNTLTAIEGSEVHYTVSRSHYKSYSDTYVLTNSDKTIDVTMEPSSIGDNPIWITGSWRDITPAIIPSEENAIKGKTGTCTSYGGDINRLTNGILRDSTNGFYINSNAVLTYTFDEPINILEIRIYSIWQDTGRDKITINSITYNNGNEIVTIPNSAIDYEPGTNYGYAYLKDEVSSMLIAENVESISINFGNQENGYVGYSEVEIRKEI